MPLKLTILGLLISSTLVISCDSNKGNSEKNEGAETSVAIKEEPISYMEGTVNYKNFVAYDSNKQGKRPAVLVIPEWWGLNDYTKSRIKQLAGLGYIAMAVDMYGDGKNAADPKEALVLATPFYKDPALTKTRIVAALNKLKQFEQTDTSNIAAIGYCYGGFVVLNAAKLGADLKGVVSFHGSLAGVPVKKDMLKAKILVCHGEADSFVKKEEVDAFKHEMDSAGVDYTFISYPNATHAFTNPEATETGKKFTMPIEYNAAADTASWNDMKTFFGKIFKK